MRGFTTKSKKIELVSDASQDKKTIINPLTNKTETIRLSDFLNSYVPTEIEVAKEKKISLLNKSMVNKTNTVIDDELNARNLLDEKFKSEALAAEEAQAEKFFEMFNRSRKRIDEMKGNE